MYIYIYDFHWRSWCQTRRNNEQWLQKHMIRIRSKHRSTMEHVPVHPQLMLKPATFWTAHIDISRKHIETPNAIAWYHKLPISRVHCDQFYFKKIRSICHRVPHFDHQRAHTTRSLQAMPVPSPHTSPPRGFQTWYLKEWEGPGGVATKDWIPTTASSDTLVWGSSFNLGDYSGAGKPTKWATLIHGFLSWRPWFGMIWDSIFLGHKAIEQYNQSFQVAQVCVDWRWISVPLRWVFDLLYLGQTFYVGADSIWRLFYKEWSKCIAHDRNYAASRIYCVERKRVSSLHMLHWWGINHAGLAN